MYLTNSLWCTSGSNVVEDAGAVTEDQGSLEMRTTVLVDVASLPPCFEYLMLLMLLVCHHVYAVGHANMYVMLWIFEWMILYLII